MSDRRATDFSAKWRAAWPEWAVAEVFLPATQREQAVAWFALLYEFADAAWGGSDAAPGLAKLAWWQEELRGWGKGARRHPLGVVLLGGVLLDGVQQSRPVPWVQLADALPVLRLRELPSEPENAMVALRRFAEAAREVEAALFGAPVDADTVTVALLAQHAVQQAPQHGDASAARALLETAAVASYAGRPRRLLDAIVRLRLQTVAAGGDWRPASRWRCLWTLWRVARN